MVCCSLDVALGTAHELYFQQSERKKERRDSMGLYRHSTVPKKPPISLSRSEGEAFRGGESARDLAKSASPSKKWVVLPDAGAAGHVSFRDERETAKNRSK